MAIAAEIPAPTSTDTLQPDTQPKPGQPGVMAASTGHDTMMASQDDLLGRVVRGAHETIDRLAQTAAPHVQRLQEEVGASAEHAKAMGDEWVESLRGTVRDNPLAAVVTALALGVLIARLSR